MINKKLVLIFLSIFWASPAYLEDLRNLPQKSIFNQSHEKSIALDPFPIGARGLALRAEFEMAFTSNLSFIFPIKAAWIDSERFSFIYQSGYGHIDPYNHINNVSELLGAKNITQEVEISLGFGIKFYPNGEPFKKGFFIKPSFTIGYAKLNFSHKSINKIIPTNGSWPAPTEIILPIEDKDFKVNNQSLVFVPEIAVGYQMLFTNCFLVSLEGGAKYRLFTDKEIAQYTPELAGFEPTLSLMVGYLW